MSHHVYNTRAFVLGSRPVREADRLFFLLTPDLGLVMAIAQGVRRPLSRLKGILLDLALADVSLVRGKNSWRITTAALSTDVAGALRAHKPALQALARATALLERLIRGEEQHPELFEAFVEDIKTLLRSSLDMGEASAWEVWTVARILYHLGYLSSQDVPSNMAEVTEKRTRFVNAINTGLRESGLA